MTTLTIITFGAIFTFIASLTAEEHKTESSDK